MPDGNVFSGILPSGKFHENFSGQGPDGGNFIIRWIGQTFSITDEQNCKGFIAIALSRIALKMTVLKITVNRDRDISVIDDIM